MLKCHLRLLAQTYKIVEPTRFKAYQDTSYLSNIATFDHCCSTSSRPSPLRLPASHPSLLPLVLSSNNFRLSPTLHASTIRYDVYTRKESGIYADEELALVPFFLSTPTSPKCKPIGFSRPGILRAIKSDHKTQLGQHYKSPWDFQYAGKSDETILSVALAPWINAGGQR